LAPLFFVLSLEVQGSEVLGAKLQSWKVYWLIKLIGLNEFNLPGLSSSKPYTNKKTDRFNRVKI
jgi:hypothetical protein